MNRTVPLLVSALLCGCGSTTEEGATDAPAPAAAVVSVGDLPEGNLYRTSRSTDFDAVCKELEKVEIVYIGDSPASAAHHQLELQILRKLRASTKLDSIGLAVVPRPLQPVLDDYARARIDWAQLGERLAPLDLTAYRSILEFAQEHRLGLVALDVAAEVVTAVEQNGRTGLSPEQAPAASDPVAGYAEFVAQVAAAGADVWKLRDDVLADSVVRWMRASPRGAQLAVIAPRDRVANAWGMEERVRTRAGRTHASVVLLDEPPAPAQFARSYADYIFVPGE